MPDRRGGVVQPDLADSMLTASMKPIEDSGH
jgi:hypothetical protein